MTSLSSCVIVFLTIHISSVCPRYVGDNKKAIPESVHTEAVENVPEILSMILNRLDSLPRLKARLADEPGQESLGEQEPNLESFVLSLSPEKRRALSELLAVLLQSAEGTEVEADKTKQVPLLPAVSSNVEVITLPQGQNPNLKELLKYILNSRTDGGPAESDSGGENSLRSLVKREKAEDIARDPSLNQTIDSFVNDLVSYKLGVCNFA